MSIREGICMRKIISHIVLLMLLTVVFDSCIREDIEDCQPLRITIAVKDKNYFNIDKVEQEERKSEDLPFKEYVPTIYYTLRNEKDGTIVEESEIITVDHDQKTCQLSFDPDLPHGKYVITVWGGMKDLSTHAEDKKSISFHPENAEGRDLYLVNDTIIYDPYLYDHTIEMERVKGKLIIQAENLPAGMEFYHKSVNNLFGGVNHEFRYHGTSGVNSSREWSGNNVVTKTILAPSAESRKSMLDVTLHDGSYQSRSGNTNVLHPDVVPITMSRNQLTVVRYIWDDQTQDFEIYALINDNWEIIHGLRIED